MSRTFSQSAKYWIQTAVLKLLSNDSPGKPHENASQTEPLEIAVVVTGKDDAAFRSCLFRLCEVFEFDIATEIVRRQPRTPQQVQHGVAKMAERRAGDTAAHTRRELLAERHRQVFQRHSSAVAVEQRHAGAKHISKNRGELSRQQRNDSGGQEKC